MKRFISAILVSIIALISLSGCLGNGGDYVAEIGGTKISRGEFMVYLIEQKKNFEEQGGSDIWGADFDGVSAIEVAKQNALDSITMVKSAVKQTDSLGIKLDEKDISDVDNQTKNLMSEFSSEELNELSLDYDKIHSILEESALQGKVYNYVTSNYVVNSDEMSKYIEEYSDSSTERGKLLRDEICRRLKLTSVEFQSLEGTVKAVGLPSCELCTYCWNGRE
ncbi:MAG: SurA N-terminal domain-containing protein [Ruminococcus sp.]|nr:SurA N-terminal domain-containing protein [Ruminococcus sp.]